MTERRKWLSGKNSIACVLAAAALLAGCAGKPTRDEDSYRYGHVAGAGVAQGYLQAGRYAEPREACQEALRSGRETGAVEEVVDNDFLDGCVDGVGAARA